MPVQDDAREQHMVALFNLTVPPDRSRGDTDAQLDPGDGTTLSFELKSTSGKSVATVRDFGPDHIAKWRHMHWLFAFYDKDGIKPEYCVYASPSDMRPWIADKERYVRPDLVLAARAPALLSDADLTEVLSDAGSFSADEARSVMKNQWSAEQYRTNADLAAGRYSRTRMLEVLRERCGYVVRRGSTLNNPHISGKYFKDFERIKSDHASALRRLVRVYLEQAAASRAAGDGPPEGEVDPLILAQAGAAAADPPAGPDTGEGPALS